MEDKKKKCRKKTTAVVEYSYDVQDDLLGRVNIQDVAKSSGTKLSVSRSREAGFTTFVIRGTRCQIREALRQITVQTGQWVNILEETHRYWVSWVEQAFPDFENKTYFIPPVYIRRVPTIKKIVSGVSVVVLPQTDTPGLQKSDIIDDDALQRVLYSLRKFSKVHNEVFVCLSQFAFGSYLGEPSFAPAVAHLPLPSNLPKALPWSWRRGDFDVLIIHKNYGFVIIEVKAVKYKKQSLEDGRDPHANSSLAGERDENTDTPSEDVREQVIQKLKAAAEQLNKGEAMLSHLVQDIAPQVNITKIIACPNLTTHEIQSVFSHSNSLEQELCQCFHVSNPIGIASSILCSDHLCSPKSFLRLGDRALDPLRQWWQEHVAQPGHDETSCNPPDWYQNLIARFCGPASTVTVPSINEPRVSIKTLDKAVAYVGDCYAAHIMLFPEQLELLIRAPPRVFLCGPPGTGKTILLFLMALEWLRQGNLVFVLSTWDRSIAASLMLVHLLQEKLKEQLQDVDTPGRVQYLYSNFRQKNEVETALDVLKQEARKGPLFIVADEVGPDYFSQYYVFPEFCSKLLEHFTKKVDGLHLWAASCHRIMVPEEPENWQSSGWERKYLTRSLRSPPYVTEEISQAVEIKKDETVWDYTERDSPDQTEGPPVHWIHHDSQQHRITRAEDCEVCGKAVARFLLKDLHLRDTSTPPKTESAAPTPASLQYRDVLLLSWNELRENAAILRAMTAADIPVKVMRDSDIGDVATARSDVVWAARQLLVRGLERKVVVCIHNYDDSKGQYVSTRLSAMSRCTSQLVVVCLPPENDSDENLTKKGC
ncbi:uncharacterized protein LOC112569205 [Pomacea canaliculata]|uniref:uncharacterized protein LOC112569205 n=1 Tax=Pomacea canaliculata TaxID=400727 RepID=UPI000D72980A|nr:uncharacterized protein LOC112569205 [Pomacea canaliculata]